MYVRLISYCEYIMPINVFTFSVQFCFIRQTGDLGKGNKTFLKIMDSDTVLAYFVIQTEHSNYHLNTWHHTTIQLQHRHKILLMDICFLFCPVPKSRSLFVRSLTLSKKQEGKRWIFCSWLFFSCFFYIHAYFQ